MPFLLSRPGRKISLIHRRNRGRPTTQASHSPCSSPAAVPTGERDTSPKRASMGSLEAALLPSISWPVPVSGDDGTPERYEPKKSHHQASRQASWCSTVGASEPVEIPYSPRDELASPLNDDNLREFETTLKGGDGDSAPCGRTRDGVEASSCWTTAWYSSEPWNHTTEYPEEVPPAHFMIWEQRSSRSTSLAPVETASEQDALSDSSEGTVLPFRGDSCSEDSIFEMDM